MGRSPNAVPRIRRMLSSISRAWLTRAIRPVASVRTGNDQPAPMNSSLIWRSPSRSSSVVLDRRALDLDGGAARQTHSRAPGHLDLVALDADLLVGLDRDVVLGLDPHLALADDVDLLPGLVQ